MSFAEAQDAALQLAYAYGGLKHEEYIKLVGGAFLGKEGQAALAPVEDFINTQFVIPDLKAVNDAIYKGVTDYLNKNLALETAKGGLGLAPEAVTQVVTAV